MSAKKNVGRQRRSKNTFVTHSGNSIKVNRSMSDRIRAHRDNRTRRRANRLATLPKSHVKRMLYRLQPKRLAAYWFSRDGAIMALKVTGVGIVVVFVLLIGLFAYFRKDLPKLNDVTGGKLAGSITYYDRTGTTVLWQDYDAVKRVPVQDNQISQFMKDATVAIEDKNFYHEGGFSISGIARAGLHDIFGGGGGGLQGASTIPEQVVKLNENWTGNRTIATKVKEVILSVDLSREYSKDDILTGYLNVAPYGGVDYGVEAAARDYFNEDASQLTLAQAAMLAAIPQAPSYYSPYSDPQYNPSASTDEFGDQALIARQQYILDQMVKQHYITQEQADAAKQVDILAEIHPLQTKYAGIQDPYFVLAAKQQLENTYGAATVNRGGWKVITTLNASLQNYAEQDVANNVRNVASAGGDEQAMVAEDVQTGQVVAQVGGEDFSNPQYGQINYANTNLSPGSSMKPFMYAALIQNNTDVGAGSVLYDSQSPLPGYPCTDKTTPTATTNGGNCLWDDTNNYPGPETIRYALATSRNVPAVKASYEIVPDDTSQNYTASINKWIGMANSAIGVNNAYACYQPGVNVETATAAQQTQCYGSAAIGSGDMTIADEVNGDATLARLGAEIPQTYILNITDSSGKTIYKWQQPKPTQVYNPDTAYIINNILDDPRASYLPASQKFQNYNGWDIAVKTGTENQEYNGIMTAWTTKYAVVAFAGYHTLNVPLHVGLFEQITEPISRTWIDQALTALHTKPVNWVQPSDVKTEKSFVETAKIDPYGEVMPSPSTDLSPSWYTPINSGASTTATIDKVSGFLATSCTPALAKETEGGANDAAFSVDIFYPKVFANMKALEGGATGSSSAQTDNIHNCSDVAPSVTLTQSDVCEDASHCDFTVAVTQGTDALSGGSYTTAPAGTIALIINGNTVQTQPIPAGSSSPYTATFNNIPGSTTGASVEAQAVDSVLYSGTSTITVNNNFGTAPPAGP
jgi:membrane peptidoglycan carboxypeptidase